MEHIKTTEGLSPGAFCFAAPQIPYAAVISLPGKTSGKEM
jgi:hypothetical protein